MTPVAPVFVLAPARSCSSVVTAMIGAHPQLFGLPELAIIGATTVGEANDRKVNAMRAKGYHVVSAPGLTQAVAQLVCGGQRDEEVREAREWIDSRRNWAPREMFDALSARVAPRAIVEQSPETVMTVAGLTMLERDFPDSPIIHLVRHPITTVNSMVNYWKNWPEFAADDGRWQRALLLWLTQHRRVAEFTAARQVSVTVRAEDVLSDDASLRHICAALSIDASKDSLALMRRADSCFVGEIHPDLRGSMDPGFIADPRPRALAPIEPVQCPREWNIDPFLQMQVLDVARQLGYPIA